MAQNVFAAAGTAKTVADDFLTALQARNAPPLLAGCTAVVLATRVRTLAEQLRHTGLRSHEEVAVLAQSPLQTLSGCLALWLAGGTPLICAPDATVAARLTLDMATDAVHVDTREPASLAAALVICEPLVGYVAHPLASLGILSPADSGVSSLRIVADWRVDAWLPLLVRACMEGAQQISLHAQSDTVPSDDTAVLACSSDWLEHHPQHAAITWGGTVPPPKSRQHGVGDHFVLATTLPGTRPEELPRCQVHLRHRICNAQGRPLPQNAWGLLTLAGRIPAVSDQVSGLLDVESNDRVTLTEYRARLRSDGRVEIDDRDLDPLRIAGRRLSGRQTSDLLAKAGLSEATLIARKAGSTVERRTVLCLQEGTPDSETARTRVESALPSWAMPLSQITLPSLPRNDRGELILSDLAANLPPDEIELQRCATAVGAQSDSAVSVALRPTVKPLQSVLLPTEVAASGGGHYPSARQSLVVGPPQSLPERTLCDALTHSAATGRGIRLIDADGHESELSYRELLHRAACLAAFLRERGLRPTDELIISYPRPADLFVGIWGAILSGVLAVPLTPPAQSDPNDPLWTLLSKDSMLTRRTVLTNAARLPVIAEQLEVRNLEAELLAFDPAAAGTPLPQSEWTPSTLAVLLLTSGSTGKPKGVPLSHTNILSLSEAIRQVFELDAGETTLNWLPVDHVGGLIQFHMRDVCLANRQVHADTAYILAEPSRWMQLCDRYRVSVTWSANFAINLVNECREQVLRSQWDLSCVKVIENGGEAVGHAECQRFLQLLRRHGLAANVLRPVFGMSETSSAIIAANNMVAGSDAHVHWLKDAGLDRPVTRALPGDGTPYVEVGLPTAGVSMRVVAADGSICPEGVCGRIEVTGPQVIAGYYHNPRANAESFTDDGWLRMGDCGFIVNGSLTVTGREKDVIIVNGLNYPARALETQIEALPGVREGCCAVISVRLPDTATDDLIVFYTPTAAQGSDAAAVEGQIVSRFGLRPAAIVTVEAATWPRTSIGKIRRPLLRQRFLDGEYAANITLRRSAGLGESARLPNWHFGVEWVPSAQLAHSKRRILWLGESAPAEADLVARDVPALESLENLDAIVDARWYSTSPGVGPEVASHALTEANAAWEALCRAASALTRPPLIVFATTNAFVVDGSESSVTHCALPALAQSLSQSYPRLDLKVVDGASPPDLLAECTGLGSRTLVAYRSTKRLIPALRPLRVTSVPSRPSRILRPGGRYVLIGGLGGIGAHLCQHLLRRCSARLLVIGRSPADGTDLRARTLAYLREQALESGSGEIEYACLDASREQQLRSTIDAAEARWGARVDAVFNLAGEGSILERLEEINSNTEAQSTSAVTLANQRAATRITLAHAIESALEGRSSALVTFGSVNGFFGGAGFSQYSAACAYQTAYARWSAKRSKRTTRCIDWSSWQETGMASGAPPALLDLAGRRGFGRITVSQGLASLHVALASAAEHLQVGLLPEGLSVAPLLPYDAFEFLLEVRGTNDASRIAATLGVAADRVRCLGSSHQARTPVEAAQTESLLRLWREVLGAPNLTSRDSFFAAGGDSIRAIQVVARAKDIGIHFNPLDLFEHRTVNALLMHLASQLPAASAAPETEAADESVFVDPPPIVAWWLEGSARLADTRNLFTMGLRLRLGAEIGASTVREALLTLLDRHDALRLRLLRMSAGWVLSSGSAPQSLAFEEHAATPGDRRIEEIEQALHRGLDPCIGPIVRAAYVRLADEPHSLLILVVHHLAIDGVSWRILEDELQALLLPGPRATPAKAAGYLPWARAVARQAESIDAKALTDAWSARLPKVWGTLPCETTKQALEGNARILTRSLPATRSNQQSDTGFNEMLLTAVSWALSRWTQCESIVIDVEGHGRLERGITMDLTRSIGWFTSISPLHFDLRGCRHPNEALSRVRTAVTQHRGRALEWGLLRYSKAAPENSALWSLPARQLSFNYLGAFDTHQLGAATSVASVAGSLSAEQHPQAPRRYVIDVAAQVVDGRLHFGVKYSSELLQEPQIESWLDHIEVTLEQLIDTDEDQLACALEQVQL